MILPLFCILIWNAFLCQSVNPEVDKQSQTGSEGQEGIAVGPAAGSEGEEGNLAVEPEQRINVQEDEPLTASGNNRQGHEAGSDTAISEHGDSISAESAPKENIPEQGPSVTEYVNGMSIDGVISDHDIRSASREPGSSDISSGQADVESDIEELNLDAQFAAGTGKVVHDGSTDTVDGGPEGAVSASGEPEGNGHLNRKASGDGLGRELEFSEDKSLKKAKERNKAAGDADQSNQDIEESKSFSEDGQLLPQTPHLPPSVPAVEFAIDPAANIITSNLHVNSGSVASQEALELVRKIHEINENNRLRAETGMAWRGFYEVRGSSRFYRANDSDVLIQLGSFFDIDSGLPAVYHNDDSQSLIQIPVPSDFASISQITGYQQVIIEVEGSLPFLIFYNPFDQQFWLVCSANFSDINEEFWDEFIISDFRIMIRQILEFIFDEACCPVEMIETSFFVVMMLLYHISRYVNEYGLFEAYVRDCVIGHRMDTDRTKTAKYRQPPESDSTRVRQTEDAAVSPHSQTGNIHGRKLKLKDRLDRLDELNTNKFNSVTVRAELVPPNQLGCQENPISSPSQAMQADEPNPCASPQQSQRQMLSTHGCTSDNPSSISQQTDTQDKTSQGARPKQRMTQAKVEEQEPPSEA